MGWHAAWAPCGRWRGRGAAAVQERLRSFVRGARTEGQPHLPHGQQLHEVHELPGAQLPQPQAVALHVFGRVGRQLGREQARVRALPLDEGAPDMQRAPDCVERRCQLLVKLGGLGELKRGHSREHLCRRACFLACWHGSHLAPSLATRAPLRRRG
jgi:hypothetical protein